MGRPFLYSLTYGKEGVVHAIESELSASASAGRHEHAEEEEILIISHERRNSHYDATTRRDSTRSTRASSCESSPMRERLS
jgi:hypothetical protein